MYDRITNTPLDVFTTPVKLFRPPVKYVLPVPFKNDRPEAIISADAKSLYSDYGNLYEYDSMELSSLQVLDIT